jgi:trk system potassium uptake protein
MAMNFLVIGLGTFGSETARALYRQGGTVLAIDNDEDVVAHVSDQVTQAVCANATDEEALRAVGAFEVDTAIVALRRHFDITVLVTHTLKKQGLRQILVQVDTSKEADAIKAVGATSVIFPERDMAEQIARRLMVPDLADQIPLGDNVGIIEFPCPAAFVGKTLIELGIRKNHGITVIALKSKPESDGRRTVEAAPSPEEPLEAGQSLVLLGKSDLLSRFKEKMRG